jgi:hyperosmotically inducible periplasmic protein
MVFEARANSVAAVACVFALITATLVLSGCAAALLGKASRSGAYGGGQGQGSSTSQPSSTQRSGTAGTGQAGTRTAAEVQQDRQIVAGVRNRLSADAVTKTLVIGVDAYQGTVTLRGDVQKAEHRSAAERVARSVAGVRNVHNELRVR